ncbi:hypothetical protein AB0Y20_00895 [Heyndrickxia oleronia]|uniref:hypothetical protein n=1 Tax=Heyndrickxia oleronia TaxID=38875 RepID=UPI003F27C758
MIDLNEIKPKVKGESDKYSWNLYRFLNKLFKDKDEGKYIKNQLEIHWLTYSRWDGKYLEFDPDNLNRGMNQVLILPFGLEHGRSFYDLNTIMGKGRAELFHVPWRKDQLTNITDWFFSTYQKDGRCIFDRNHNKWWQGEANRFTYINNTRRCNWCGEWHKKEIHKEVKIERKVRWVK